ncbi:dephospho-CoA kinase [Stieleria mannarensis]|uniref:dephospho-CoA kinase n=1 Tax=Stieleria mannarensis TaxID=2755585 RepID=UPI0016002926|nr:dephospho-CoA kinase [Rhodopirellula sp. JC639]
MLILGIVGSPAGGKSSAAEFLASLGAEWINADLIAREFLGRPDVVATLASRFGDGILAADGSIDRSALADLVFGNDSVKRENLAFLESVLHPLTRQEIRRRIAEAADHGKEVALLDVPLLFESGWDRSCDQIWCIDATRENRLLRSKKRGWDAAELDRRESNQMPIETKCRLSNLVMRNDATLDALHQNLRLQWRHLARMLSRGDARAAANSPPTTRHCTSDQDTNS